jgi:hypothetical protein
MIRFKRKSFTSSVNKKNVSLGSEEDLQKQCNDWMNARYAELEKLFFFNSFQGMKLNYGQIAKAKKTGGLKKGLPDFIFLKNNGKYSGLFIELKKKTPFLQGGRTLKADDGHLQIQQDVISQLLIEGHYACFCWSLEQFKKTVTDYMECRL